jgi:TfoX/Sxy family transcriptional regulator of competence genes
LAHDEVLAARVRVVFSRKKGIVEKKMFGGVCFMVNGHMCCGITGKDLVLRLGEEGAAAALEEPHTREMDFTGRVMKSMVFVHANGTKSDEELRSWVKRAIDHARSLPQR